jgi:hypothetical protein
MAINKGFDSSKGFFMVRAPLLFFLFFLGFLAFLIGVNVNISGTDSRDISNIKQGLFKICMIEGENNNYFDSFNL